VTLYEVLAGELPFYDDDPLRLLEMHVRQRPTPLSNKRPDLPDSVIEIVHTCLAKKRENRYADAMALRDALELSLRDLLSIRPGGQSSGNFASARPFVIVSVGDEAVTRVISDVMTRAGIGVRIVRSGGEVVSQLAAEQARAAFVSAEIAPSIPSEARVRPLYVADRAMGEDKLRTLLAQVISSNQEFPT